MLYTRQTFTCPAAGQKTSQRQWDLAMLIKPEYIAKYKITAREYDKLLRGRLCSTT